MKKLVLGKKVAMTLVFTLLLNSMVFADPVVELKKGSSDTTIKFTQGTGLEPVTPINPETPDIPIDPPQVIIPGSGLAILRVTDITFADTPVPSQHKIFQSTEKAMAIQVNDSRGIFDGWNVTGKLSVFNDAEALGDKIGVTTLGGAKLTFKKGAITTRELSSIAEVNRPTIPPDDLEIYAAVTPVAVLVMKAEQNAGVGLWAGTWLKDASDTDENRNVTLDIPYQNISVGKHKALLTWTITAGPIFTPTP